MKALQFTAYGGPEVLEWADAPDPHAGHGQVRVAVRAASVNPIDWKTLAGALSGGQPMVGTGYLGYDAAGVVDEVGDGVTGVSVGDDVLGRGQNTYAEYAVLDSWAAKPSSIDWAVAAAAGVVGETGERGLRLLEVKAGDTLFVDGGAGGVGAVARTTGLRLISSEVGDRHHLGRLGGQADQLLDRGLAGDIKDSVDRSARWRGQSSHGSPGAGRRATGTEQAGDQGADLPVRPCRRGLSHQSGRPRSRKARLGSLTPGVQAPSSVLRCATCGL